MNNPRRDELSFDQNIKQTGNRCSSFTLTEAFEIFR